MARKRSSQALSKVDLHRYARAGAAARLEELQRETVALLRVFPDLARGASVARAVEEPASRARRRPKWTAAQRKAVSKRMRKYWAGRKQTATAQGRATKKR